MHVRLMGWEDLEKRMATHSSILAWRIPQRSLAGYSPQGHKKSDTTERLNTLTHTHTHTLTHTHTHTHSLVIGTQKWENAKQVLMVIKRKYRNDYFMLNLMPN